MTILYFTSTGNSLWTARQFDGETLSIPQLIKNGHYHFEDDVIGLVVPIYGFTTPRIVKDFLDQASWKAGYGFAIGTHGDRAGSFCADLKKYCGKRGLRLDYANALKMVDNALIGYEMDQERKILPDKKVEEHCAAIQADIAARRGYIRQIVQAEKGRNRLIKRINPILSSPSMGRRMITCDEKCNRCGTCARLCPRGNITVTDRVKIGKNCELCGGCIHNCPQNALHQKGEKSAARWRHPDVTLAELIRANGQTGGAGT